MARRIFIFFSAVLSAFMLAAVVAFTFPDTADAAETKVVYLTFDDGPSLDDASQNVLDVLDRFDVKATFFVVGDAVEADPEAFQNMVTRGHAFGNHSDTHARLTDLTDTQIAREFDDAQTAISAAGGPALTCFRAPYGASNDAVRRVSAERGLSEIFWQADGADYIRPLPTVQEIVDNLDKAVDGDNIIMHDGIFGQENTAPALDQWLTEKGDEYEFRIVPDCIGQTDPTAPRAPLSCIAKLVDGVPVVSWTHAPSDNAVGYRIRRDQNSSNTETVVGTVGPNVTSWVDPSAFNASNAYQIETFSDDGATALRTCGPVGGLVVGDPIEPQFEAPRECSATVRGTSIDITWTTAVSAAEYVVYRTANGNGPYWRGRVSAPETSFTDTNRTATLEYFVASKFADDSKSTKTPCDFDPGVGTEPSTVASCDVTVDGDDVTVTWDSVDEATNYVIYRTVDASPQYWRGRVDALSPTFADTTRPGEIEYFVSAKFGAVLTARQPCTPLV